MNILYIASLEAKLQLQRRTFQYNRGQNKMLLKRMFAFSYSSVKLACLLIFMNPKCQVLIFMYEIPAKLDFKIILTNRKLLSYFGCNVRHETTFFVAETDLY